MIKRSLYRIVVGEGLKRDLTATQAVRAVLVQVRQAALALKGA